MVFPHHAVRFGPQPYHNITQRPVIHVHAPLPKDLAGVDLQLVPLLDMVIQKCGQQIVGRSDGMEIPGKMKVQIFHGYHLGIASPGSAAFDPETRSQGRLPQRQHGFFAKAAQCFCQTDAGGGFALAGRRRVNGCHQHQLAIWVPLNLLPQPVCKFGFVLAVQFQVVPVNPISGGDFLYRFHLGFLGDFNVRFHSTRPPVLESIPPALPCRLFRRAP